jgi:hypothetical protein
MKYHFISDDSFFLLGIETFFLEDPSVKVVQVGKYENFYPANKDILFVAIQDPRERYALLTRAKYIKCRVFIIADIPASSSVSQGTLYPVLSKKLRPACIRRLMKSTAVNIKNIKLKHPYAIMLRLIVMLAEGKKIAFVSERLGLSAKYVYLIKRKIFCSYGISESNSAGLFIVRDLMKRDMLCRNSPY